MLLFQISRCRIINQPAALREAGAMAGTVPCVLLRIPLQRAAQVWAPPDRGGQQAGHCLKSIDSQLGPEDRSGGGKDLCPGISLSLNEVAQDHGRYHGGGHAPFIEACGHIQARRTG